MTKITALVESLDQKNLNSDQKKYFSLLLDIERLGYEKEASHAFSIRLLNKYHQHMEPIVKANAMAYKEMAVIIDKGAIKGKLSKKTMSQCEEIIIMLIENYYEVFPDDETSKALYEHWAGFEIATKKRKDADYIEKFYIRNTVKSRFGIDVDFNDFDFDLNDPLIYQKFQEKYEDEINKKREADKEKWAHKIKTKRELAKEDKDKVDKRNLREIYIALAKQMHPDKASNDIARAQNEAAMKRITEAYENNDIFTLLNLEIQYLVNNESEVMKLEPNKIKSFINILKAQKKKAIEELEMTKANAAFKKIFKYNLATEDESKALFDKDFAAHKNNDAFLRENLKIIKTITNKNDYQKFVEHLHELFFEHINEINFLKNLEMMDEEFSEYDYFIENVFFRPKKKRKKK